MDSLPPIIGWATGPFTECDGRGMKSLLLFHLLLFNSSGASRLPLDGVVRVVQTLLTKEGGDQRLGEEFQLSQSFTELLTELLTDNLNEHGLRPKRSTDGPDSDWDKEIDLTSFGLDGVLFQLKYLDPPRKGAKVHMNLRGAIGMIRDVCAKLNLRCNLPDDLEVDLIFDSINSRISFKSKFGRGDNWYGETEIESMVEEGLFTLKFDSGRMKMILEWPWPLDLKNGEKTTEVRVSVKGGTSCDLDIRAVFSGSWSRGHSGESVLTEVTWNGAKRSALLTADKSEKGWNSVGATWTLQLVRPSEHWTSGEPDPTYNYTLTFQGLGFLVSGSLNDLGMGIPWTSFGFNPWTLLGYTPRDTEGGQWMLHVNWILDLWNLDLQDLGSFLGRPSILEMDARVSQLPGARVSSPEKELNILKISIKEYGGSTPPLLITEYKIGDGMGQTFNKVDLLIDDHGFDVRAIKEKVPGIIGVPEVPGVPGAFNYKFRYEREISGHPIVHTLKYSSLIHIECPSCPHPYIEELSGNFTFTELNPDKFELSSEERFVSEHKLPFFTLATILGIEPDKSKLPRKVIQFDVSRAIVFEKPELLSDPSAKTIRIKQRVDLNGVMWNQLEHNVNKTGEWDLKLAYSPQDNKNEEVWTVGHSKYLAINEKETKVQFDNWITFADNQNEELILFFLGTVGSLRTQTPVTGLSLQIDMKKNLERQPGGERSVFFYKGDLDWTSSWRTGYKLNTKEFISQSEQSPFYEVGKTIFGKEWRTANISRQVDYKFGHTMQPYNLYGLTLYATPSLNLDFLVTLDKERFNQFKIDTVGSVGRILWYHQPIRGLFPITRDLTGQDELTFSTRYADGVRQVEINGNEVLRIDCNHLEQRPNQLPFVATLKLPSGKTLTGSLFLPKQERHWTGTIDAATSVDQDWSKTQFRWSFSNGPGDTLRFWLESQAGSCDSGGTSCSSLELVGEGDIPDQSGVLRWNTACLGELCNHIGFQNIDIDIGFPDLRSAEFHWNTACQGKLCDRIGFPPANRMILNPGSRLGKYLVLHLWKYSPFQCGQMNLRPSVEASRECEEKWNGYKFNIEPITRDLVAEEEIIFNATHNATRHIADYSQEVILTKIKSFGQFPAYIMWGSLVGVFSTFIVLKYIGIF